MRALWSRCSFANGRPLGVAWARCGWDERYE